MKKTITIELFNSYMTENIEPCDWRKKYFDNYLARVELNSEGEEERTYAEKSHDDDLYFNVKDFKVGDILIAGTWNKYKKRGARHYYVVDEITDDRITFVAGTDEVDFTTYRKAFKTVC